MTGRIAELSTDESPAGGRIVQNISWLTLVTGAAGALLAFALRRSDWSQGILIGAILAWLNFRWLKRGVTAMLSAPAEQAEAEKKGNIAASAILAFFRYALIGILAYVIFIYLHIPLGSLAVGLCALGAATIAASVWHILRPVK